MTDYTAEITALQRARVDMQAEKATNRVTVKAKYAERIRQEIEDADQASEFRFAELLRAAVESGVPQTLIRSEVLRTNDWARWTYWRDLAEIEPDRVTFSRKKKARDQKDSPFKWSEDFTTLTIEKDSSGKDFELPPVFDVTRKYKVGKLWMAPAANGDANGLSPATFAAAKQDNKFRFHLSGEIQRAIDNGDIEE